MLASKLPHLGEGRSLSLACLIKAGMGVGGLREKESRPEAGEGSSRKEAKPVVSGYCLGHPGDCLVLWTF